MTHFAIPNPQSKIENKSLDFLSSHEVTFSVRRAGQVLLTVASAERIAFFHSRGPNHFEIIRQDQQTGFTGILYRLYSGLSFRSVGFADLNKRLPGEGEGKPESRNFRAKDNLDPGFRRGDDFKGFGLFY